MHAHGENLFSYCVLDRERLVAVRMPHPLIGIVLHGVKEVWVDEVVTELRQGEVFVLPADRPLDVVNIPGAEGFYESLLIEIAKIPDDVPPLGPAERAEGAGPPFRVPLTSDLCDALVQAASASADDASAADVRILRLTEALSLLRPIAAARALFQGDLGRDVAWLLNTAPSQAWTVEQVADAVGLGPSTLRRRLAAEGCSFRRLMREARLRAARRVLEGGASSLAAAEAAGYASRSHFARRYRETYGQLPSER